MINVLNALFFRLRKAKILWILLAVLVVLCIVDAGLYQTALDLSQGDMDELMMLLGGDTFELTMSSVSSGDSYSAILTVIFVALFIGADFSDGTIRNAVLANKTRWQIFGAYLIVSLLISTLFVAVQMVVYLVYLSLTGAFANYVASVALTGAFSAFGIGIVSCWTVAMLTLLMLVLLKKKALALIFPLIIVVVVSAIVEVVCMLAVMQGGAIGKWEWIPFVQQMFFSASANDGMLLGKILLTNTLLTAGIGVGGGFVFAKAQLK